VLLKSKAYAQNVTELLSCCVVIISNSQSFMNSC